MTCQFSQLSPDQGRLPQIHLKPSTAAYAALQGKALPALFHLHELRDTRNWLMSLWFTGKTEYSTPPTHLGSWLRLAVASLRFPDDSVNTFLFCFSGAQTIHFSMTYCYYIKLSGSGAGLTAPHWRQKKKSSIFKADLKYTQTPPCMCNSHVTSGSH